MEDQNTKTEHPIEKNDGTDPKKNDDSSPGVNATTRSCRIKVTNNLSSTITDVSLTLQNTNTYSLSVPSLASQHSSFEKPVNFETGWWADFDYWNVSFKLNGTRYSTPYNDRCNISYEDEGGTINCTINKGGNWVTTGNHYLETKMPKSSNCSFGITKVS